MGVYIKEASMPESCFVCELGGAEQMRRSCPFDLTSDEEQDKYFSCRHPNCPLVPVPPHGRLGDLDEMYEKFARLENEAMNALKTTTTGSVNWIKWSAILTERTGYKYDIADAPTIIEAEESEI